MLPSGMPGYQKSRVEEKKESKSKDLKENLRPEEDFVSSEC